jgi:uncharacterized protein YegP (UPF0339 family)
MSHLLESNMNNDYRFILRAKGRLLFTSEAMTEDQAVERSSAMAVDGITAEVFEIEDQDHGEYHPHGDPQA